MKDLPQKTQKGGHLFVYALPRAVRAIGRTRSSRCGVSRYIHAMRAVVLALVLLAVDARIVHGGGA